MTSLVSPHPLLTYRCVENKKPATETLAGFLSISKRDPL